MACVAGDALFQQNTNCRFRPCCEATPADILYSVSLHGKDAKNTEYCGMIAIRHVSCTTTTHFSEDAADSTSIWVTQTLGRPYVAGSHQCWQAAMIIIYVKAATNFFVTASHKCAGPTTHALFCLSYCRSGAHLSTTHSVYDVSNSWTRSYEVRKNLVSVYDFSCGKFHLNTGFLHALHVQCLQWHPPC